MIVAQTEAIAVAVPNCCPRSCVTSPRLMHNCQPVGCGSPPQTYLSQPVHLPVHRRSIGIGIVVHDAGNPFFARLADTVAATAEARGFSVVMSSSRADESRQEAALRLLQEHQLSGSLLTPGVRPPRLTELAAGTPVVLLDYPGDKSQCSVRSDDLLGGRLAAQHLIDRLPQARLRRRSTTRPPAPRPRRRHRDRRLGCDGASRRRDRHH